jgi:hypothetical protein
MDDKVKAEVLAFARQTQENIKAAAEIANANGFDAGVAYLVEHGSSPYTAPQMLGLEMGTWQPVEYDEDGKVKTILN